jgi:hypothetical protein
MPNGYPNIPNYFTGSIVAAGSTQATATALNSIFNEVTGGSGGVALPQSAVGEVVEVVNYLGSSLNVYPYNGGSDAIVGYAQNAAYPLATQTGAIFTCIAAGSWQFATWSGQGLT